MDFTKIRLIGLTTIDLPIIGALPSDIYTLKGGSGLGPTEVDVFMTNTQNQSSVYQGRQPQNREIVLRIGLNPNYSTGQKPHSLREALYGLLTPGSDVAVQIQIMNGDTVLAVTSGYVKRFEDAVFTEEPEVQITFDCLGAYLTAPAQTNLTGLSKSSPAIVNAGTAPAGFHMELTFTSALSTWSLTRGLQTMKFDYSFAVGDRLIFDTIPGKRAVQVVKASGGATVNIMSALSSTSVWHMLYGGTNTFTTTSSAFNWGTVYYTPRYWGV